jgi:hypothetical protein
MQPLTPEQIRGALVNVDDEERGRVPLPGLHETVWDEREFLGWRDPERPHRGYIVYWDGSTPRGVTLRAAESAMPSGKSAMCSLCHTQQPAPQVSLFVAPKVGHRGKRGDTVGTYLCRDLSCSALIRMKPAEDPEHPQASDTVRRRSEGVHQRLAGFTARVIGDEAI